MSTSDSKKNCVFVGGVPLSMTLEAVKDYFSQFGAVVRVKLNKVRGAQSQGDLSPIHRGCGFVEMLTQDGLSKILEIKEHYLAGQKLDCRIAMTNRERKSYHQNLNVERRKVFIGKLPKTITKECITNFFSQLVDIEEVTLIHKESKDFGICFLLLKEKYAGDSLVGCSFEIAPSVTVHCQMALFPQQLHQLKFADKSQIAGDDGISENSSSNAEVGSDKLLRTPHQRKGFTTCDLNGAYSHHTALDESGRVPAERKAKAKTKTKYSPISTNPVTYGSEYSMANHDNHQQGYATQLASNNDLVQYGHEPVYGSQRFDLGKPQCPEVFCQRGENRCASIEQHAEKSYRKERIDHFQEQYKQTKNVSGWTCPSIDHTASGYGCQSSNWTLQTPSQCSTGHLDRFWHRQITAQVQRPPSLYERLKQKRQRPPHQCNGGQRLYNPFTF